jgi:uncharacterized membrane protein required for colicin V production
MNWLDFAFVGFLCMTAALGFLSGFLWQAYSVICLIASYFSSMFFHSFLVGPLSNKFSPGSSLILSHIIVFVATFAILYSLGLLMRKVLNLYPGFWGGLFGALLGLFQGMLLCGVIAVGLKEYSTGSLRQDVESSPVVSTFAKGAKVFYALIPGDIKDNFGTTLGRAKSLIEGAKE